MSARLVLATHNAHKVGELRAILAPVLPGLDPASVVGARDVGAPEPVEDGVTFVENALIKARALAAFTGLPAVADDSGLSVDVLGGAPGIFSARWAGKHGDDAANLALLLAQLADIADAAPRRALRVRGRAGAPRTASSTSRRARSRACWHEPRGAGGFGYDPILVPTARPGRARS